jgi:hypothetical protein
VRASDQGVDAADPYSALPAEGWLTGASAVLALGAVIVGKADLFSPIN